MCSLSLAIKNIDHELTFLNLSPTGDTAITHYELRITNYKKEDIYG